VGSWDRRAEVNVAVGWLSVYLAVKLWYLSSAPELWRQLDVVMRVLLTVNDGLRLVRPGHNRRR
jgi:hypothetical protein